MAMDLPIDIIKAKDIGAGDMEIHGIDIIMMEGN
jgi:hypothetical protein